VKVLAFMDHYLPGYKAGGPVHSLENTIARLPRAFRFWVVTRNHDLCEKTPYGNVRTNAWNDVGAARVFYLSTWSENVVHIGALAARVRPDVAYVNSLFSRLGIRYLMARRLGLAPRVPVVLAPRGELAPGALRIRAYKKAPYLKLALKLGLLDGVTWQASTDRERGEIEAALASIGGAVSGNGATVAPDLVAIPARPREPGLPKAAGRARFVFLSRISTMKNLHLAISFLGQLRGDASLDIYGPIDDPAHWAACQRAIAGLPARVRVNYHGPVSPAQVPGLFAAHEVFVLPTRGENFGYAIFESLASGCPIVLSDRTSWSDVVAKGCGFVLPLEDPEGWVRALQACVDMDSDTHARMVARSMAAAAEFAANQEGIERYVRLFEAAAGKASSECAS
jgi:glycosyltransferase involved in cell wall biosynthesis